MSNKCQFCGINDCEKNNPESCTSILNKINGSNIKTIFNILPFKINEYEIISNLEESIQDDLTEIGEMIDNIISFSGIEIEKPSLDLDIKNKEQLNIEKFIQDVRMEINTIASEDEAFIQTIEEDITQLEKEKEKLNNKIKGESSLSINSTESSKIKGLCQDIIAELNSSDNSISVPIELNTENLNKFIETVEEKKELSNSNEALDTKIEELANEINKLGKNIGDQKVLKGSFGEVKFYRKKKTDQVNVKDEFKPDEIIVKTTIDQKKNIKTLITELQILNKLRNSMDESSFGSENVAKFYGFTLVDRKFGIVMGALDKNLESILRDKLLDTGEETKPIRYFILLEVANGLSFIHKNLIIHNDLFAKNIIISKEINDYYNLKVQICDFGISRILDSRSEKVKKEKVGNFSILLNIKDEFLSIQRDILQFGYLCIKLLYYEKDKFFYINDSDLHTKKKDLHLKFKERKDYDEISEGNRRFPLKKVGGEKYPIGPPDMTNLVLKCILQEDSKGKNTNRENERPSTTMIRRVLTTKFIEYLWIERETIVMSEAIDNSSEENGVIRFPHNQPNFTGFNHYNPYGNYEFNDEDDKDDEDDEDDVYSNGS